ncbi:hypothetical protein LCGC14_1986530, partial [marine sediment metagenome]
MALFEYNIPGGTVGLACPLLITTPPPPDLTVRIQLAQTFTPQTTHTIDTARLFLHRSGSPGNFTVDIYAVDGNSLPIGASLCSGISNGDTLTTNSSGSARNVDLGAGAVLTADVEYAMVLDTPNAVAGTNAVLWQYSGFNSYARGQAVTYPEEIDDETTAPNWWNFSNDSDFKFA